MTNQAIIRRAIKKAEQNGLDIHSIDTEHEYAIIFSHTFAKALFGTRQPTIDGSPIEMQDGTKYKLTLAITQEAWQYHLQQMVISPDPIRYLEQFLD